MVISAFAESIAWQIGSVTSTSLSNMNCKSAKVVTFQGKEITLENLSPVFTPEQEAAKRRELEQQLYEVFRKYADKRQSEEAGA